MQEKLRQVFADCLSAELTDINDATAYGTIKTWDSVAHMAIITAIEDEFEVMLEPEDIIEMSSFGKAKEILARYI